MHQMPIEISDDTTDDRLVEIKQQLTLHDPDDFVTVSITREQIPDVIKALQARLNKKQTGKTAAVATKFESHFWSRYPNGKRKVNRAACERTWIANNLDEHADMIADALGIASSDPEWKKENGAFVPLPMTWLNQRRWEAAAGTPDTSFNNII